MDMAVQIGMESHRPIAAAIIANSSGDERDADAAAGSPKSIHALARLLALTGTGMLSSIARASEGARRLRPVDLAEIGHKHLDPPSLTGG